ncbi:hypothetical protein GOBAR_AA15911 [Gossypium barbadense]|uniref:Uncharacterized protein n=1 Tax=Gossypium barbadense TaxID=3634 RepID=A0A2P5XN22_GOSBA|nr:hypothetical protein GOBAR_AA15911 [Gossypium barbadense]
MCPAPVGKSNNVKEKTSGTLGSSEPVNCNEEATYEPWMVVERRNGRGQKKMRNQREGVSNKVSSGSRFLALNDLENLEKDNGAVNEAMSGKSGAKIRAKKWGGSEPVSKWTKAWDLVLVGLVQLKKISGWVVIISDPKERQNESGMDVANLDVNGQLGDKGGSSRNGKKLNQTIRNREDKFKLVAIARVPLTEFLNSMVELINAQLDMEMDKGLEAFKGNHTSGSGNSKQ